MSLNESTIIFTIARMNPPTSGHMLLIKTMMLKALELNLTQINLILSGTVDKKKNPIKCSEKRFFLLDQTLHPNLIEALKTQLINENPTKTEEINGMQVKIVCMDDPLDPEIYGKHPIFKSINFILMNYGYPKDGLNMILMIGEDRISDYNWIQKSLQERTPPINLDIQGLARPEGAMSATFMRNLAVSGNFEEFDQNMAQTGLDEVAIKQMYDDIRVGLSPVPTVSRKKKATNGGRSSRTKPNKISRTKPNKSSRTKTKKTVRKTSKKTSRKRTKK